jgi:hypothetical protein
LLTASGKLDMTKLGGPSRELAEGMTRRGVYGISSRMFPNTFQLTFDFLTPTISIERRYTTTIPQQRLFFLNSPMVHNQAEAMAEKIGTGGTEQSRVTKAFEIAFQRAPTQPELTASLEFMHSPELLRAQEKTTAETVLPASGSTFAAKPVAAGSGTDMGASENAHAKAPQDSPMKSLCWALLSSAEFLYIN